MNDKSPVLGEDGLIHLSLLSSRLKMVILECPEDNTTNCTNIFAQLSKSKEAMGVFEVQEDPNLGIDIAPGDRASDPMCFNSQMGAGDAHHWLEGTAFYRTHYTVSIFPLRNSEHHHI